jgi:hypothetical protein
MLAASSRPVLADTDLDALLAAFRVRDGLGRLPADAGWEPTWNLNAAAAEGWRWKAARVAGDYSFSADDASYSKGDVLAQCEAMVAMYAAKDTGSSDPLGADGRDYDARRLIL